MTNTWHIKRMDILYTFSSIQVSGGVKLAFGVTGRKSSESLSAMPTDEIQGALFPNRIVELSLNPLKNTTDVSNQNRFVSRKRIHVDCNWDQLGHGHHDAWIPRFTLWTIFVAFQTSYGSMWHIEMPPEEIQNSSYNWFIFRKCLRWEINTHWVHRFVIGKYPEANPFMENVFSEAKTIHTELQHMRGPVTT